MTTKQQQLAAVRVGLRVRPLSSNELIQGSSSVIRTSSHRQVHLGERCFTYDYAWDERQSQSDIYDEVGSSYIDSVLAGYNATIIAYGQTGSGKTYTMGSESHEGNDSCTSSTGLIPRFIRDLLQRIDIGKSSLTNNNNDVETHLTASFLEVYGEELFDLLDPNRPSVPLREDTNGSVVCTGLQQRIIPTVDEALKALHDGTTHRTTASTLMNLTSSRSHAVFTLTLVQKKSDSVSMRSCLTFVDLAGSERLKKTGASGQQAREGIQINQGLLALGNVIHALAAKEDAAKSPTNSNNVSSVHIPYRQSKLTRLLQEALGGNSQTLFLACVSPADSNANESLSTLHYANRARDIQNAPQANIEGLELRNAQEWARVLTAELVKLKFGTSEGSDEAGIVSSDLLASEEVQNYLTSLKTAALPSDQTTLTITFPSRSIDHSKPHATTAATKITVVNSAEDNGYESNTSILDTYNNDFLSDVDPDAELAILDQLLVLQKHTEEFEMDQRGKTEEIEKVDGELAKQETLLLKLRQSFTVYHEMKERYEHLMAEAQQLESEKTQLADKLDKALRDPSHGCTTAIRKELERVEIRLARTQGETVKHRQLFKNAQDQTIKCKALEKQIMQLKAGRAQLVKKQKEDAVRHREYTQTKTREIKVLQRQRGQAEHKISKLQREVDKHMKTLDTRHAYISKLQAKLQNSEKQLVKLVSTRQKQWRARTSVISHGRVGGVVGAAKLLPIDECSSVNESELSSVCHVIDALIADHVRHLDVESRTASCLEAYRAAMDELVDAVKMLEQDDDNVSFETTLEREETVKEAELRVELIDNKLEQLKCDAANASATHGLEEVDKVLNSKSEAFLKLMTRRNVDRQVEVQVDVLRLKAELDTKAALCESLQNEVEDMHKRQAVNGKAVSNDTQYGESTSNVSCVLTEELERVKDERDDALSKYNDAMDRIAVMDATFQQVDDAQRRESFLLSIQALWNELGLTEEERVENRLLLENCFDNISNKLLHDARASKDKLRAEVDKLERDIASMQQSLGTNTMMDITDAVPAKVTLAQQISTLREQQLGLLTTYNAAVDHHQALMRDAVSLTTALAMSKAELCPILQDLLSDNYSITTDNKDRVRHTKLDPIYLKSCEKEVAALRILKSKMLSSNASVQSQGRLYVNNMDLDRLSVVSLVENYTTSIHKKYPSWWDKAHADSAINCIMPTGDVLHGTQSFARHLTFINDALEASNNARQLLSEILTTTVETTLQSLLSIVNDQSESLPALSSFQEALEQLPRLSRGYIDACLREIKSLCPGVETMIQSEMEVLTLIWEALEVPSSDRGSLWDVINSDIESQKLARLESLIPVIDSAKVCSDPWLTEAVEDTQSSIVKISSLTYKLCKVHEEVEKQRCRQDTKSRIITLDSEIRLLDTKVSEFESRNCTKDRLLTKKNGSTNLLKEERFRKHMQSRFTRKLEELATHLKRWVEVEGNSFDVHLLSDEVCTLLENSDQMKDYVEQRTNFMHLNLLPSQSTKKARRKAPIERRSKSPPTSLSTPVAIAAKLVTNEPSQSRKRKHYLSAADTTMGWRKSKRLASTNTAAAAAAAATTTANLSTSTTIHGNMDISPEQGGGAVIRNLIAARTTSNSNSKRLRLAESNINRDGGDKSKAKNKVTLPPFGHVLQQAKTPKNGDGVDKENVADNTTTYTHHGRS